MHASLIYHLLVPIFQFPPLSLSLSLSKSFLFSTTSILSLLVSSASYPVLSNEETPTVTPIFAPIDTMSIIIALFTALAVVQILFFSAEAVGSAGTLAISLGTSTVCGISSSTLPRTIYCTNISESVSTSPYQVYPNVSFDSISAGTTFLCGLKSSRRVFHCWNGHPVNRKRVYRGSWVLSDLTVGETQVAAIDRSGNGIRWWRKAGWFPSSVLGNYRSLTSGNNFTCAITTNGTVTCWGPLASAMQAGFSNYSMITIVAGNLHMCGLDSSGFVICKGRNSSGESYAPPGFPYEYTSFALGSSHTCAITQLNGTAVCWGGSGGAQLYQPLNDTTFEFLVAGGNLTCGLTTNNYLLLCWGSDWTNVSVSKLSLPRILPGICVPGGGDECNCGTYPHSESLCNGTGIICQRCDRMLYLKRTGKAGWKLEVIFGSVLLFCILCVIAYCLWVICRSKAPNSDMLPIAPVVGGGNNNASDTTLSRSSSSFSFGSGNDEGDYIAEMPVVFPRLLWSPGTQRLGRLWFPGLEPQNGASSSSNHAHES